MKKRTHVEEQVASLAETLLQDTSYELYDVECVKESGDFVLRIFIDSEDGVDLVACEEVSRLLDEPLDALDPIKNPYHLEVSSPGVERRLNLPEHFERVLGEKVRIKCYAPVEGKREHVAILASVSASAITVTLEDKTIEIPFDSIAKVSLSVF